MIRLGYIVKPKQKNILGMPPVDLTLPQECDFLLEAKSTQKVEINVLTTSCQSAEDKRINIMYTMISFGELAIILECFKQQGGFLTESRVVNTVKNFRVS